MISKIKREGLYFKLVELILREDKEASFEVARELLSDDSGQHILGCFKDIEDKFNANLK